MEAASPPPPPRFTFFPQYAMMVPVKKRAGGVKTVTNGNKLFCWQDPYDLEGTAELFAAAMEENARFQAAR